MRELLLVSDLIDNLNRYINSVGNRIEDADWFDYLTTAKRDLQSGRDLPWAKMNYQLLTYDYVLRYPLPEGMSALISVLDPVRDVNTPAQNLIYSTEKQFRRKDDINLALEYGRDGENLLCNIGGSGSIILDNLSEDLTEYTLSGDGSNLAEDTVEYRLGDHSLKFTIADITNTTTLEKTTTNVFDITDYKAQGKLYTKVYLPAAVVSIILRMGNDSTNYYESTITTQSNGEAFTAGWNDLMIDISGMVETGSVTDTEIDYFVLIINNTGVSGIFRYNGLYTLLGKEMELVYSTNKIIKVDENTNTYQSIINDSANLIVWDGDFKDLLIYRALELAGFYGYRDIDIVAKSTTEYTNLNTKFNIRYPRQEKAIQFTYYKKANRF